jgi:hypothetical protein
VLGIEVPGHTNGNTIDRTGLLNHLLGESRETIRSGYQLTVLLRIISPSPLSPCNTSSIPQCSLCQHTFWTYLLSSFWSIQAGLLAPFLTLQLIFSPFPFYSCSSFFQFSPILFVHISFLLFFPFISYTYVFIIFPYPAHGSGFILLDRFTSDLHGATTLHPSISPPSHCIKPLG